LNEHCSLNEQVINLLGGEQTGSVAGNSEERVKSQTATFVQMPDLIDTGDLDDYHGTDDATENQNDQVITNLTAPTQLIDDIFGDAPGNVVSTSELKNDDDPFADVSFHTNESKEHVDDIFSGLTVDDKRDSQEDVMGGKENGSEIFDIFGPNPELPQEQDLANNIDNLMIGLSIDKNASNIEQKGTSPAILSGSLLSDSNSQPSHQVFSDAWSGILNYQAEQKSENPMFPPGAMPYNIPPSCK
jgi:hypothetical protein